jgi:predicted nucleic acid-binding Zn ribbon protein
MEKIKDIIENVLNKIEGKQKKENSLYIVDIWEKVVGKTIAQHTKPVFYKKKVLHVVVDQATWVYELNQKYKKELIRLINEESKEEYLKDICFKVGDID